MDSRRVRGAPEAICVLAVAAWGLRLRESPSQGTRSLREGSPPAICTARSGNDSRGLSSDALLSAHHLLSLPPIPLCDSSLAGGRWEEGPPLPEKTGDGVVPSAPGSEWAPPEPRPGPASWQQRTLHTAWAWAANRRLHRERNIGNQHSGFPPGDHTAWSSDSGPPPHCVHVSRGSAQRARPQPRGGAHPGPIKTLPWCRTWKGGGNLPHSRSRDQ